MYCLNRQKLSPLYFGKVEFSEIEGVGEILSFQKIAVHISVVV